MLRISAVLLGVAALTSCQVVADIESHDPDPLPKDCVLPVQTAGGGRVRLANVLPSGMAIDICARPTGSSSYGRPILRSSGRDAQRICGAGLKYGNVTIPFGAPAGENVDFKIIESGKTCSAPALAEKLNVSLGAQVIATLVYMGAPDGTQTSLQAWYETPSLQVTQNRATRFINAIANTQVEWGAGSGSALPTVMTTKYLSTPMTFGQLPKPNQAANAAFEIDDYGYLSALASKVPTGAILANDPEKRMLMLHTMEGAGLWTYYAIGAAGSAYPVRGLICRDQGVTDKQTQECTPSEVEAFRIDVFNAGLYGAFAAIETERGKAVIEKLAARGSVSDLLCVSEIARHDDLEIPEKQKEFSQEALRTAALAVNDGFKYFVQGKTTLDTPLDDTVAQDGSDPPPLNRVPCSAPVDPASVDTVYKCLIDKCSSMPGSPEGVTAGGTNCYSQQCGASALALLLFGQNEEDKQCFNCIVLNGLSYIPWGKNRTRCMTDTRRPYAFEGRSTSMLLSKLELRNEAQFVIPTSAFRRVALYANVKTDKPEGLDVYCVHAPPLLGSNIPYTGPYGGGANPANGSAWSEEQVWDIKKVVNWIKKKSEGRPAIIMGDWSSSSKYIDPKTGMTATGSDGLPLVADVTPETTQELKANFTEAIPLDGFIPRCTRCPAGRTDSLRNVYNVGFSDPMWTLRVYVKDPWAEGVAQSAELFYNEPADFVTLMTPTDFGLVVPPSDTWGYRVTIRRP